jgi:hypothetical protein
MKRLGLLITLLLSAISATWAQKQPIQTQTIYLPRTVIEGPAYTYHEGTALLRDGSLLKGRFQFNGRSAFIYRANSQATKRRLRASLLQRLALADSDTLVTARNDSTIFIPLGNRLFRQLTGGETTVLDRAFTVDEDRGKIGSKLYILDTNQKLHKFTSLKRLNDWFYEFQDQSGKKLTEAYLNQNEIVKAVATLNKQ